MLQYTGNIGHCITNYLSFPHFSLREKRNQNLFIVQFFRSNFRLPQTVYSTLFSAKLLATSYLVNFHCVKYDRVRVLLWPVFSRVRTESLYGKIWVRENPYSGIFYAVFDLKPETLKKSVPFKDFFSKCDQIRRKLRILSHLPKKYLMENVVFCAVIRSWLSVFHEKNCIIHICGIKATMTKKVYNRILL